MKVYKLTQEQKDKLLRCNTQNAIWAACEYEGLGICIEDYTLNNSMFIEHKKVFDSFEINDFVNVPNEEITE